MESIADYRLRVWRENNVNLYSDDSMTRGESVETEFPR